MKSLSDDATTFLSAIASDLGPALTAAVLLGMLIGVPLVIFLALRTLGRWSYTGEAVLGLLRLVGIPYCRGFHGLKVEGAHFIPRTVTPRGLIIVSTHGGGLDPIIMQCCMHHPIRWLMSAEMMMPSLMWVWKRQRVIPVCFDKRDAIALKTAITHVNEGGTLGIFPEGAIERPPRQLRPFSGGLRLILSRTKAPVLVGVIDPGRPTDSPFADLFKPMHPKIRFLALIEPGPEGHGSDAAEKIFDFVHRQTNWPINDAPLESPNPEVVATNLRIFLGHE